MESTPTYTMDDTTIGHVAQLLQLAILTGTDIIDHFRSAHFAVSDEGIISLHPEYAENFDNNLQKMLATAAEQIPAEQTTASEDFSAFSADVRPDGTLTVSDTTFER
jgi:DNA-binding ferritin-like protein